METEHAAQAVNADGTTTDLQPINKSKVAVYNPIEAGLALVKEKHGYVLVTPPAVNTPDLMEAAKKARQELVKFRTTLEATRKAEKEESLNYGRLVDSEARRIQAIVSPMELAYDAAITAEVSRLAAIEKARKDALLARVEDIRGTTQKALGKDLAGLETMIEELTALPVDDSFQELKPIAERAKSEALANLEQLATKARELAKEQRLAGQRQRIAGIREVVGTAGMCRTAERIKQLIDAMPERIAEPFTDLQVEAEAAYNEVLARLNELHGAKVTAETEAAELARKKEALEQQERELNAQKAASPPPASATILAAPVYRARPVGAGDGQTVAVVSGRVGPPVGAGDGETRVVLQDPPKAAGNVAMGRFGGGRYAGPQPAPAPTPAPARRWASSEAMDRPSDVEIIQELADHFDEDAKTVIEWLRDIDLNAAGLALSAQQMDARA